MTYYSELEFRAAVMIAFRERCNVKCPIYDPSELNEFCDEVIWPLIDSDCKSIKEVVELMAIDSGY